MADEVYADPFRVPTEKEMIKSDNYNPLLAYNDEQREARKVRKQDGSGTVQCPRCGGRLSYKINDYGGYHWCNTCEYASEF